MIRRIKIRDFKSIRELDLELGPVTVLIGRSGTGKSNLVQAIRFLRNLLLNFQEAINYEFGWERIAPVGEPKPKTSIELFFTVPGVDLEYNYFVAFRTPGQQRFPGQIQLGEERLSLGKEKIYSRMRTDAGQWEWKVVPNVAPSPQLHEEQLILSQFPSLQPAATANAALSSGIGYYHFPASALTLDPPQSRSQNLFQSISGLSDNAANYQIVLRAITQDFQHPNIRKNLLSNLREVNPSIQSAELDSLTNPYRVIIGHKAGDRIFSLYLDQESDGLRRFYAHLLALYQTPSKLTLIFEEPENAIFPGALSLLADEFKAAPRENRGQVILTTHSPTLLDAFDVDSVRVVDIQHGCTRVAPIAPEQRQAVKDHLLNTGELLTVDRARLDEEALASQPK
jgi:predicted ATPase